jgi:hypothetical protein
MPSQYFEQYYQQVVVDQAHRTIVPIALTQHSISKGERVRLLKKEDRFFFNLFITKKYF